MGYKDTEQPHRRRGISPFVSFLWVPAVLQPLGLGSTQETGTKPAAASVPLAAPIIESNVSVEGAIRSRRSVRDFARAPLSKGEVAQLLWAAQGVTDDSGKRTAPSAGATYPLEIYLVVGEVDGLEPAIYRYNPDSHELLGVAGGDVRNSLRQAAWDQPSLTDAPAVLVVAAVYERTRTKYGERAARYVHMEAGHAAQNVYLQAASLHLGTVVIGAFNDSQVKRVMKFPSEVDPLYLMPIGKPDQKPMP